jgi:hypothetical protein
MAKCWYCDCEAAELDDEGTCGCVELIIPKSMQEEQEEDDLNQEEE